MEVKGMGKQKSYLERYANTEYSLTFLPKVEIMIWVDDLRAEDVARKIVDVACTGRMGDGKIFIMPAQPCEAAIDLAAAVKIMTAKQARLATHSRGDSGGSASSPSADIRATIVCRASQCDRRCPRPVGRYP